LERAIFTTTLVVYSLSVKYYALNSYSKWGRLSAQSKKRPPMRRVSTRI
jgi:hypothetical protein